MPSVDPVTSGTPSSWFTRILKAVWGWILTIAKLQSLAEDLHTVAEYVRAQSAQAEDFSWVREKIIWWDGIIQLSAPPPPGFHGGPYCPSCWEDRHKLITIHRIGEDRAQHPHHHCPVCKENFPSQ
jgi:hypothetical protein